MEGPFEVSGLAASSDRLLDAIGEAVIVTDDAGLIVSWNSAAESLYGWSAAEVTGHPIVDVLISEPNRGQTAEIVQSMRTGARFDREVDVTRRDGSSLAVLLTCTPVLDDDGVPVGAVGISRDITESRRTTEQLRSSQRRFRALIQGSGDLFAITDAEGVITFLDGPIRAQFGIDADALVGMSVFELVPARDLPRAHALWAERLATTTAIPPEDFWSQAADGTWRCLSWLVNNFLDDLTISGIAVTARDVTDRKHLEHARAATTGASSALVHATSEADLLDELCNLVVKDGTYHLAWIALTDPTRALGVRRVASTVDAAAYIDALELHADAQTYRGPLVMALETGELCVIQDVAALPESTPWRRLALDYGWRSMIALPLAFTDGETGVLAIYSERTNGFTDEAVEVLKELAEDLTYGVNTLRVRVQRTRDRIRLEDSLDAAVRAIATAAELRDPYTAGHQRRVSQLAAAIATKLGFDPDEVLGVTVAASIHDIGKLAVPAEILSKPGRLTETEFALIKQHAQAGHDIVAGIDFPWPVATMILQHHERLDGSGYPNGLSGDAITPGARIIAVADTVEAMQSHRPYRPSLSIDASFHEIAAGRGSLYDPDVVDACIQLFHDQGFAFTDSPAVASSRDLTSRPLSEPEADTRTGSRR